MTANKSAVTRVLDRVGIAGVFDGECWRVSEIGLAAWGECLASEISQARLDLDEACDIAGVGRTSPNFAADATRVADSLARLRELEGSIRVFVRQFVDGEFDVGRF